MNDPKFFLLTERYLIRRVAERWRAQYGLKPGMYYENIYHKLKALDAETATKEDIKNIIGNDSWTRQTCNICCSDKLPAIVANIHGEHHTTCIDCINTMHSTITKEAQ